MLLSEWKLENKKKVSLLEDVTIQSAIGGNLCVYLTVANINMIKCPLDWYQGHKRHLITITPSARKLIVKDNQDNIIFSVPSRLPMIVEPKKLVYNMDWYWFWYSFVPLTLYIR